MKLVFKGILYYILFSFILGFSVSFLERYILVHFKDKPDIVEQYDIDPLNQLGAKELAMTMLTDEERLEVETIRIPEGVVIPNPPKIIPYNQEELAKFEEKARQNDAEALYTLGVAYAEGEKVNADYQKAKAYLEQAVELEYPKAYAELGILYADGLGVEIDYLSAKELYEKGIEKDDAKAINCMGMLYESEDKIALDYSKAASYFKLAAKKNYGQAIFNLGLSYLRGQGVEQNSDKAIYYFEKLAEQDNLEAIIMLGALYNAGLHGISKNIDKFKFYLEQAAKFNSVPAQVLLATHHYDYRYSKIDRKKTLYYLKLAARQGEYNSIKMLGLIYKEGLLVDTNLNISIYYRELSEKSKILPINADNVFVE